MKKKDEKERDYYLSGYALNSYQPEYETTSIGDVFKTILFVTMIAVGMIVSLGPMVAIILKTCLNYEVFFGFLSKFIPMNLILGLLIIRVAYWLYEDVF